MLESILTLLVEEVRGLKKSNQELHKEVVLLREKQQQTDEKVERIAQTAPSLLSFSPSSSSSSSSPSLLSASSAPLIGLPNPHFATAHVKRELQRLLPFLAYYRMKNGSFVVDDLRKPFLAMQIPDMSTVRNWSLLPCGLGMPMIISANRVFCSVVQVPLNQLVGSPFSTVCRNETNKRLICRYARNRGAGVSGPIDAIHINRTSTGKIRTLRSRLQVFYGPDGQMKWLVCCFDSMVEQVAGHEPVHITFPSPLLSCLMEEQDEAGAADYSSSNNLLALPLGGDSCTSDGCATTTTPDHTLTTASTSSPDSSSPQSFPSPTSLLLPVTPSPSACSSSFSSCSSSSPSWSAPLFSTVCSPLGFCQAPDLFSEREVRFELMEQHDAPPAAVPEQQQQQQQPAAMPAAQQQQQQPQEGFLQQEFHAISNPSPPPFLPSPLTAQDDLSWLLASPKPSPSPSPSPFRYQPDAL